MLVGLDLDDGWTVEAAIAPGPEATGGNFASTYRVTRGGETAFLKALDFVGAMSDPDPPRALQSLTTAFNFERDLVRKCGASRMRNVVQGITDGQVDVPGQGLLSRVSYMIFEMADGDIREFRRLAGTIDVAWAFRTLHHASLGLTQLHRAGISHQDLKPSNVLTFDGGSTSKLADLGRACVQDGSSPYEVLAVAGDGGYAPPEAAYGFNPASWAAKRKSSDLFHLGSLLLFQLTGVNARGALFAELDQAYWPATYGGGWSGSFEDVLVFLRDALGRVSLSVPHFDDSDLRQRATRVFRELCEPDPRRRGHPKNHAARSGDPYALERYVSDFAAMAARAERRMAKVMSS